MRLFVAVWPPGEVLDLLGGLERPADAGVRWTLRDQWHVTLRFLGEVADDAVPAVLDAVAAVAAGHVAREVELGPATRRFGRGTLVVPVAGLDDLAAAVREHTAELGRPDEGRVFQGHLTLARAKGKRATVPRSLEAMPVSARWTATEIAVVRSHLGDGPARYETIGTSPLQVG